MRIGIVGAGIAGTTAAYWLRRSGHDITLIEKAPGLRAGGYLVDFWGVGYEVAELMGLRPGLRAAGYEIEDLRLVDESGCRVGGFRADGLRRMTRGRYTSLPRGALVRLIFDAVDGQVETIFGARVTDVAEDASGVTVTLDKGRSRRFDLLLGADGVHSAVRRSAFGPDTRYEKDLGYRVAAFEVQGYRPRDGLTYVAHNQPGSMISRVAMRGDRTMFLMVFTAQRLGGTDPGELPEAKAALRQVFGNDQWECPAILAALDDVDDIYFDRVSQMRMEHWAAGRVMLIGDAAAAVSLLAGEGTGLAMAEAYVLAGELHRAGADYRRAFASHRQLLHRLIAAKQSSARRFASAFAPSTALGVWARNHATRLLATPYLGELILRRELRDEFTLPRYGL